MWQKFSDFHCLLDRACALEYPPAVFAIISAAPSSRSLFNERERWLWLLKGIFVGA